METSEVVKRARWIQQSSTVIFLIVTISVLTREPSSYYQRARDQLAQVGDQFELQIEEYVKERQLQFGGPFLLKGVREDWHTIVARVSDQHPLVDIRGNTQRLTIEPQRCILPTSRSEPAIKEIVSSGFTPLPYLYISKTQFRDAVKRLFVALSKEASERIKRLSNVGKGSASGTSTSGHTRLEELIVRCDPHRRKVVFQYTVLARYGTQDNDLKRKVDETSVLNLEEAQRYSPTRYRHATVIELVSLKLGNSQQKRLEKYFQQCSRSPQSVSCKKLRFTITQKMLGDVWAVYPTVKNLSVTEAVNYLRLSECEKRKELSVLGINVPRQHLLLLGPLLLLALAFTFWLHLRKALLVSTKEAMPKGVPWTLLYKMWANLDSGEGMRGGFAQFKRALRFVLRVGTVFFPIGLNSIIIYEVVSKQLISDSGALFAFIVAQGVSILIAGFFYGFSLRTLSTLRATLGS